jgi:hypothetical protein
MSSPIVCATFCAAVILCCGCATQRSPTQAKAGGTEGVGDHGYALLFDVLKDEKDVSKLLVVKRERPELRELIKEISETAGRASRQLETFVKSERSLDLTRLGLPTAEVETRAAIAKAKSKELLTESGKHFELKLLLSQSEALTYAAHLAETVAKSESNPARAGYLLQLAGSLHGLQRKVVAMLQASYSSSARPSAN